MDVLKTDMIKAGLLVLLFQLFTVNAQAATSEEQAFVQQLERWHSEAGQGDADAMFNLGQVYRRGLGVDVDLKQAQIFYQQAADLGHAGAQFNLANLYFFRMQPRNNQEAERWWLAAARQGMARAQYQLGLFYIKGPTPDKKRALKWLMQADESGYKRAAQALIAAQRMPEPAVQAVAVGPDVDEVTPVSDGITAVQPPEQAASQPEAEITAAQPFIETKKVEDVQVIEREFYRAQLGAFSDQAAAQALRIRVSEHAAELLKGIPIRAYKPQASQIYKVQAGEFVHRREAINLCEQLFKSGFSCFVVKG